MNKLSRIIIKSKKNDFNITKRFNIDLFEFVDERRQNSIAKSINIEANDRNQNSKKILFAPMSLILYNSK